MDIYQFPALVVVDQDRFPIAVVTEGDLVRAVTQRENLTGIAEDPAHIFGSKDPTTMPSNTEIGEAFHRMRMSGLTVLPVVEDDCLAGIVLRVDLMQAMMMDTKDD